MATTGIVEGTAVGIYIGGTLIAAAMAKNLDMNLGLRDANNSDSGDSESKLPGRYNWAVSGRSQFEFDAGYGFRDLYAALTGRTQVAVMVENEVTGDYEYGGNGYVTQLKATFPDHENSEYDWAITGDGDLDETIIS